MAFPFTTTAPIGSAATLGLVVLQADRTLEHDFRRLMPVEGVALHVSRVPSGAALTRETIRRMEDDLPAAAGLMPEGLAFDVVGYGCTSGAAQIGPDKVAGLVRAGCQTRHVTDPVSALVAACRSMGIARLALLSPYIEEVSGGLRAALAAEGIATPVFGSFEEEQEAVVSMIDAPSILQAAQALAAEGGVDGVFLSCTNLRTLDVIAPLEDLTGLPVLSSNQVLAWHMGQLAGIRPAAVGRLMAG